MNGSPWMMHMFFTKEGALWFPTNYDSWLTTNGNHQHATLQDGFLADCFEWRHKWWKINRQLKLFDPPIVELYDNNLLLLTAWLLGAHFVWTLDSVVPNRHLGPGQFWLKAFQMNSHARRRCLLRLVNG